MILTSSLDGTDFGALVATSSARGFIPEGRAVGPGDRSASRARPAEARRRFGTALLRRRQCAASTPIALTRSTTSAPLRVVLADDSVLLREGIASLLEGKGFKIVGQSGTAEDLLLKVRSYQPDVAIVDIKMPPTQTDEGLRAAKEIREKYPDTSVLVLSQYVEEGYALELLQGSAEGVGYLLKDRVYDLADFVAAVKRVAAGRLRARPERRLATRRPATPRRSDRRS